MLYAGRDATEEFNSESSWVWYRWYCHTELKNDDPLPVLHDPKVVKKYAPDSIIGKLK